MGKSLVSWFFAHSVCFAFWLYFNWNTVHHGLINRNFHLTFTILLHYLVKFEAVIMSTLLSNSISSMGNSQMMPDLILHSLWPPNSLDLNPVDYALWLILREWVYKNHIKGYRRFSAACRGEMGWSWSASDWHCKSENGTRDCKPASSWLRSLACVGLVTRGYEWSKNRIRAGQKSSDRKRGSETRMSSEWIFRCSSSAHMPCW